MGDKKSLISIIVPIYNIKSEYIEQCVDSLICQSLRDIEIILVNDGSKETCKEFCDELKNRDKRIKVIHQENMGVSAARNKGISVSNSQYIMFVDADDWLDEKTCEVAYKNAIKGNYDIVFFGNCREFIGRRINIGICNNKENLVFDKVDKEEFNPYDMKIIGSVWGKLYSRNIIKNIIFDETLTHGEDVEFNFRVFKRINKCIYLNRFYYHYRYIDESTVRTFKSEMINVYESTLSKIKKIVSNGDNIREYNAYCNFVGVVYMVLSSNYIFTQKNSLSFKEKIKLANELREIDVFSEGFRNMKLKSVPITRRALLMCAKYNFSFGVFLIVKVRQIQCRIYNLKKGGASNERGN